mmetsp:Transcript_7068/g.13120  ORF Transcript_7068/g.13120 Transcript_7068/m.13120 type:complete len:85 (-) Transcript_7068:491-745(-)
MAFSSLGGIALSPLIGSKQREHSSMTQQQQQEKIRSIAGCEMNDHSQKCYHENWATSTSEEFESALKEEPGMLLKMLFGWLDPS